MKRILDDMTIFCAVVEAGSLKRASEQLAVPHSTVSRRIEALEQALGLKLLHRTTRDVNVSSRGLSLYKDCVGHLTNIQSAIKMVVDDEVQFRGKLNVSMPVKAGIDFLGAWLIDFAAKHPELTLDISLSNDNKNLVKDDIDLAFRVGPIVDSSAIALHLWDIPYTLCCHKSFINQFNLTSTTITSSQLEKLPCVISKPATKWAFTNKESEHILIEPTANLIVDDLGLAYHALGSGKYVAILPEVMLEDEDIVTLTLEALKPRTRVMYAYYLGRRHAQSQIKHLVDYVKSRYAKQG